MKRVVSVIGLGYVGLPAAVHLSHHYQVIGFDINQSRIEALVAGKDETLEVDANSLQHANIEFSHDPASLDKADFHIIAVPTPTDDSNNPNLTPLLNASKTLAPHLKKGDIVVYESTVYPGATEEDCAPVLEQYSNLKCGEDFFIGYSPERINPADKVHTFANTVKLVSGQTPEVLDTIASVYGSVVDAGVFRASSIKVAEAAKVIENSQRDINIAFVNELSKIFHLMGIDTQEVLDAAATKWNFHKYNPGLVGGHCISVDPYYLTYKAEKLGYHPQVLLAGRRINENMSRYVVSQIVKELTKHGLSVHKASVAVLGVTFKENCPDIRNSKIFDMISELKEYQINVVAHDCYADPAEVLKEGNIELSDWETMQQQHFDAVVLAVPHSKYRNSPLPKGHITIDIKSALDKDSSVFRL